MRCLGAQLRFTRARHCYAHDPHCRTIPCTSAISHSSLERPAGAAPAAAAQIQSESRAHERQYALPPMRTASNQTSHWCAAGKWYLAKDWPRLRSDLVMPTPFTSRT